VWQKKSSGGLLGVALDSLGEHASLLYQRWRRSRRIGMRSTPIAQLVPGAATKVTGVVESPMAAVTPFTQTACAYYVVRLEQRRVREERGYEEVLWEPVIEIGSLATFWLVGDDGAKVLVDPSAALSDLPRTHVSEHPRVNDENADFAAFLRSQGVLPTMYMGIGGDYRFFESIVVSGSKVSVWGSVRDGRVAAPAGYRDASVSFACIGSARSAAMHIMPVEG
jgi:hypothetical protein